jgi:hypothetical protein
MCKHFVDSFGFYFLFRVAKGEAVFQEEVKDKAGNVKIEMKPPTAWQRLDAVKYLIDRAYGKPTAMVNVDVSSRITLEQIVVSSIDGDVVGEGVLPSPTGVTQQLESSSDQPLS